MDKKIELVLHILRNPHGWEEVVLREARLVACITIEQQQAEIEALRHELERAEASREAAINLLLGIHSLLYPPHITLPDGRVMAFRPTGTDPHEVLQELSDRIRAITADEIAAINEARGK